MTGNEYYHSLSDAEKSERYDPIAYQCSYCVHRFEFGPGMQGKCDAFPGGIPYEVLVNEFDHRKPYPNDKGVRFEPAADAPAKYKRRLEDER